MFHENNNNNVEVKKYDNIESNIPKDVKDCVHRQIETMGEAFCPILFIEPEHTTDNLNCGTTEASKLIGMNNITACAQFDLHEFPRRVLSELDITAMNMARTTLVERIKEESLMNIMSLLDSIDAATNNFYLKYFHIRESIESIIRENNTIDRVIDSFMYSDPFSLYKMEEQDVENTKNVIILYSRNIFSAVIYELMRAVNIAVDDTILRIHLIPNIMNLKDEIIERFSVPDEDIDDSRFWILADINIKHSLSNNFADNIYTVIYENIFNILSTFHMSSYYIYNDTITDMNKKMQAERKAKKDAENDFEF